MAKRPRRIVILQAAGRLFGHYGPFKTTVADIAREARVGVGSVYLEFRSKDEILSALSRQLHDAVLEAERAAWATDGPPADRLGRVFEARLEAFLAGSRQGAHGKDLFACACAPVERIHRTFAEAEREQIARFLAEAEGALAVGDVAVTAAALLDAHVAFSPPELFQAPADALRARMRRLHEVLLAGLLPRSG